ncbi:MAG: hypothetical protein COT06_00480 [Syntrophobacteraceae bacterium CG07_land_8_20_14_0_80_61_8]|nr:MAG: hypothetical protein COT06_00480 [Syntrophobacteraceae bacterium CG07_land_8_20_14_0_80_61_8]
MLMNRSQVPVSCHLDQAKFSARQNAVIRSLLPTHSAKGHDRNGHGLGQGEGILKHRAAVGLLTHTAGPRSYQSPPVVADFLVHPKKEWAAFGAVLLGQHPGIFPTLGHHPKHFASWRRGRFFHFRDSCRWTGRAARCQGLGSANGAARHGRRCRCRYRCGCRRW